MSPELSSNWKRLQLQLKEESRASADKKRKVVPSERQQNTIAKRRRLAGKSVEAPLLPAKGIATPKRMGNWVSSNAVEAIGTSSPSSLALWAKDNDISSKDLAEAYGGSSKRSVIKEARADKVNEGLSSDVEIGKYVGMDCEMVGVGGDEDRSVLARVSMVNFHGIQIYDSFVKPKEFVTDWRTNISGVSAKDMAFARGFDEVQVEVATILQDKVLVGHGLKNDLEVIMLSHPKRDIRDTSRFSGFRKYSAGKTPSLKKLAKGVLGMEIQGGEHSSIEDARVAMMLFRRHKPAFDIEHAQRFPVQTIHASSDKPKLKKKKKKSKR